MTRVKRGIIALKRRRSILSRAKGYRWGRSKKERNAKEAIMHAGMHAFAHRRKKKGDFRKLWTVRISAQVKQNGLSYSNFIYRLIKKNVILNRKMLSELAQDNTNCFERIVDFVKK